MAENEKQHSDLPNGTSPDPAIDPAEAQSADNTPTRHRFDLVCGACGALIPSGCALCLVCGMLAGASSYQGDFPVPTAPVPKPDYDSSATAREARRTPILWQRWGSFFSASILLVLLVFVGLGVWEQYFDTSSYRAGEAILYESGGGRLMLSEPSLARPKEIVGLTTAVGGFSRGTLHSSPNGRWISYTGADGGLYLLDLMQRGRLSSDSEIEAQKLADNAATPGEFSGNSEFLVYLGTDKALYASDLSERWLVDTGVTEILAVGVRRILYARPGDSDGLVDLYMSTLTAHGGEWLLIDRNVAEVLDYTAGFERLIYTGQRQNTEEEDIISLCLFELSSNTTTALVSGVGRVLDASAARGSAIYLAPSQKVFGYQHFVLDDLAAADRRIREPDLEDYPLVAQAIEFYGEGANFSDFSDNEDLVEQNNDYRAALEAFENKQARDAIREDYARSVEALEQEHAFFALHFYQNGEVSVLADSVLQTEELTPEQGRVSLANGYIVYDHMDVSELPQLRMSEMWDQPELQSPDPLGYLLQSAVRELRISNLSGSASTLYIGDDEQTYRQWRVTAGATGVYFTVGPAASDSAALYYAPLRAGIPGEAVLIERDVLELLFSLREGVVFGTADGQYSFVQDGTRLSLGAGETELQSPENDGNSLLFYSDYDRASGTGDLYLLSREIAPLGEEVAGHQYHSDSLIYLARKGESGLDLLLWQDGAVTLVERDVRYMLNWQTP